MFKHFLVLGYFRVSYSYLCSINFWDSYSYSTLRKTPPILLLKEKCSSAYYTPLHITQTIKWISSMKGKNKDLSEELEPKAICECGSHSRHYAHVFCIFVWNTQRIVYCVISLITTTLPILQLSIVYSVL